MTRGTNDKKGLPHMRTIGALAAHYRALDPDTAVTTHFLRSKVLAGEIPHVRAGTKRLVSIEAVDAYLAGESAHVEQPMAYGQVRVVPER